MNAPILRFSTAADRDTILRFIADMRFNPRDAATWDGLHMTAMTAWQSDRLIGAIPLEPRVVQTGCRTETSSLHETVVAVHPEYRGAGIGSRLQQAIFDSPPNGAALITVFREEPQSPAYRWYLRNGFSPVMRIDSWFCDEPAGHDLEMADTVLEITDPAVDWPALAAAWVAHHSAVGGLINQRNRPLREWLAVHPYRGRYALRILPLHRGGVLAAYALLGIGRLHSETTRVDVLEFCAARGDIEADLLQSILTFAARNEYRPVRWPLAQTDPRAELAASHCFEKRWNFDMLIRALSTPLLPKTSSSVPEMVRGADPTAVTPFLRAALESTNLKSWRYAGIDYA